MTRCHGHDRIFLNGVDLRGPVDNHVCTDLCTHNACCCVHCFDDGTPVYPHDEHETLDAYVARQEAALVREALSLACAQRRNA